MSRYAQVENENNSRFDDLANKLSQFRAVNADINNIAQDDSFITQLNDQMSRLYDNLKQSSSGLRRSMAAGTGIWRYVGMALVAFFVVYTLFKFL